MTSKILTSQPQRYEATYKKVIWCDYCLARLAQPRLAHLMFVRVVYMERKVRSLFLLENHGEQLIVLSLSMQL